MTNDHQTLMRLRLLIVRGLAACAALALADAAQAADPAAGRKKAATCAACHGINGLAKIPDAPNIAGDSTTYLKNALNAYRSGKRQHEQMAIVAKRLSDGDIEDLAAWYAALKVTVTEPQF